MNLDPAIRLIEEFEGYRAKAYRDSGGVWTIGYGTTFYPDKTRVKQGDVCTEAQALSWLSDDLLTIRIPALHDFVKVPLSGNETTALLSFVYNIGGPRFLKSTLLRKLNAKRPRAEVANEFYRWTKDGGVTLLGLVQRRAIEAKLFLMPDPVEQILA